MQASYERKACKYIAIWWHWSMLSGRGRAVYVLEEKGLIRRSLLDWDTGQLLLLCYSPSAILVQTQDVINRTWH